MHNLLKCYCFARHTMRRAEEDPSEKRSTENPGMKNLRIADTETLTEIQGERRKSGEIEKERGVNTEI